MLRPSLGSVVLFACSALALAGAEIKTSSFADAQVAIVIRVIDDAAEESFSRNRCHVVAEITNRTTAAIEYTTGLPELNWVVESRPLDRDGPYEPAPLTRWGTMMSKARGLRQLGAGIAPGETVTVPFDLGRAFDVTMSRHYVLSGRFPYRLDGVERTVDIPRVELAR